MDDLLKLAVRERAEELRLEPGKPLVILLQGKLRVIDDTLITSDNVVELFRSIATEDQWRELDRCGDSHFTYDARNLARFNVSAAMQGEILNVRIKNLGR